jgi:hypothetical protein
MAHWRDSVVLLTSSDPDNPSFGTGFVFHRDATGRCFLLTCLHVVTTLERPAKGATGEPPGVLAADKPAEVWVRGDSVLDLAVLAVDGLGLAPLSLGGPAGRGTRIETAGFSDFEKDQQTVVPRPLEGRVRDNVDVWSRRPRARRRAWSLDIEIDAEAFRALADGYSGSPVVDPASGGVVGVMNLKWSGTKGHALCVRSCDLLDPPLAERLPDYPSQRPGPDPLQDTPGSQFQAPAPAATEGALAWLASTLDHANPIEQVACRPHGGQGAPHPALRFYAFGACHADCPDTLAEHLAIRLGGLADSPWLAHLVTKLRLDRHDIQGVWKALVAKITDGTARPSEAEEADRILAWINAVPAGGLRVVYCPLELAKYGSRIPEIVAGATRSFGRLTGLRPGVQVLFLFACIFEEEGLRGLLDRWRRPRLARLGACEDLGALAKLSLMDLDDWLGKVAEAEVGGAHLDARTHKRLRDTLEPLFPSDAARLRYKGLHRPALDILAQATLVAATPGDPP